MKAFISTIFSLFLYLSSQGQTINLYEYEIYRNDILVAPSEYEKTTDFNKSTLTFLPVAHEFKTHHNLSGQINSKNLNKKRKKKWARHSPPRKHFSKKDKLMNKKPSNIDYTAEVIYMVIDITCGFLNGWYSK